MNVKLKAHLDNSEIDEAMKKAERFVELLKEAKSLADDLASVRFKIGYKLTCQK